MRLELKNIEKSFGDKRVLRGVSLQAEGGRAFGLLGRNGAGKTTSIRILMNVVPADSGEVLLDGQPPDYRRLRIGYLPEERGLYPKKKIIEQLAYFAELKGLSRTGAVRAVDSWLDRLGMTDRSFAFLPTEEPAQELPAGISQQELLEQVHQAVNAALEEADWGDRMGVIAGYFFQKKLEYRALGRLLCEKKTAGGKAG